MEARPFATVVCCAVVLFAGSCLSGAWAQVGQELRPQYTINLSFGSSVALDGNTAAILGGSLIRHPVFNTDVGTVDIYEFDGSSWTFSANVISNEQVYWNKMGSAVELLGDQMVVGTPATARGAALLFRNTGSEWVESGRIDSESALSASDDFGFNLSMSSDVMVAGDGNHRIPVFPSEVRQYAYVFRKTGSDWQLEDSLQASNAAEGTAFGTSASASSNVIVVGDPLYSGLALYSREGAAYVYEHDGSAWSERQQLSAEAYVIDDARFGQTVVTDGNWIVAGAVRDSVNGVVHAGAAYVYRKIGGVWTQTQRLVASEVQPYANFGLTMSLMGDFLVVGAPTDTRFANDGGSVYFYRFNGSQWVEETRLVLPDAVENDRFGASVEVSSDWLIVGAPGRQLGQWKPGASYIYPTASLVANESDSYFEKDSKLTAFPNPVSGIATVTFSSENGGHVGLVVYDLLGRAIETIVDATITPGNHEYHWNPGRHADGLYFIRLTSGSSSTARKIIVTRSTP